MAEENLTNWNSNDLVESGDYEELNEAVKDLLCELRIDSENLKLMAEGYSPDYPGVKRFSERRVSPKIQISSVTAEKLYQTIKSE